MRLLSAVTFFLVCFFSYQISCAQDSAVKAEPDPRTIMRDTTIYLEGSFFIRSSYAYKDSVAAFKIWASKMRDTTIALDPAFTVFNNYAYRDSLDHPRLSKRDSLVRAFRDSLSAIGSALLHQADMQDTTIALVSSFSVANVYARRDSLDAIRDSARMQQARAATMQDTTINLDPAFVVSNVYLSHDLAETVRDSLSREKIQASTMQDTTVAIDPAFLVLNVYAGQDRLDAIRDSIARPTVMQDTVVALEPGFVIRDLYPYKDSVDAMRDSIKNFTDSVYTDSVSRHWAGWKDFDVKPQRLFNLNSDAQLKGRSKTDLQYNIADFYLSMNGEPVSPPNPAGNFFAAACLAFKYDDTLLLNSGLGAKVGVGVGIKIYKGKFTGSIHANMHNAEIYKFTEDDSVYLTSIIAGPVSQSLVFKYYPDGSRNEILIGEYQATFKKFYQKNENGESEVRKYSVRIIFRCRVTGGISSLK